MVWLDTSIHILGTHHTASACKLNRVRTLEDCNGEVMEDEAAENFEPPRVKPRGGGEK